MICFFLLYLPIAALVVFAFNSGTSIATWEGTSLRWFQAAWNNDKVVEASIRSVQIAACAAIIATIVAYFFGSSRTSHAKDSNITALAEAFRARNH